MTDPRDTMNILAPIEKRSRVESLTQQAVHDAGLRMSRRELIGAGAVALLAAACGASTSSGGSSGSSAPAGSSAANTLAGKPMENQLVIYNWSEYDDASTFTKFAAQHPGLKFTKTYYSSNDELLAKLNAGGTGYDIIVPSQNAVAQLIQERQLMALDFAAIPNIKNLDPAFRKPSYDPTGNYHVIKDYGITGFFYNNKVVTDNPKSLHDFYSILTKYHSKGRTNLLDGAEEVVPLALMAIGLDPNTNSQSDFNKVSNFLMSIRPGVTTIDSSNYINDAIAGNILLGQGWSGDMRRIVQARKKQGDMTAVLPSGVSEVWADNWCIPANAPHPVAAHAWINWLLVPSTAVTEMNYHNYPIPIPQALAQMPASLKKDPLFNVPKSVSKNYKYILNVSPQVVDQRTKIYSQFRAA